MDIQIPIDVAQNQNKTVGSKVVAGTYVNVGLSSGPKPTDNNQQNNNDNNNNQQQNNKPQDTTQTNQCTSTEQHTLKIEKDWIMGGSAQATINTLTEKLKERYPNITFKFETTKECYLSAGYIAENSPITNRSTVNDCQEYTIFICE